MDKLLRPSLRVKTQRAAWPRCLVQALQAHHPEACQNPLGRRFIAYFVANGKPDRHHPGAVVFAARFLRHMLRGSFTAQEVIDHLSGILEADGIRVEWFRPNYHIAKARSAKVTFSPQVEAMLVAYRAGRLTEEPLVNFLTGRPCRYAVPPKRVYAPQKRAQIRATIEQCPDPDRRERLEAFADSPPITRHLNRHLDELLCAIEDLPEAAQVPARRTLARLLRCPYLIAAEPAREKFSHRIGLPQLSTPLRRILFPFDLELDAKGMYLGAMAWVFGARETLRALEQLRDSRQDPWTVVTVEIAQGRLRPGQRGFRELRGQVKFLGMMALCGGADRMRPPETRYGDLEIPDFRERLLRHRFIAEILSIRAREVAELRQHGHHTFPDGQRLEFPGEGFADPAAREDWIRSHVASLAGLYECRVLNAIYREMRLINQERRRPVVKPRLDLHDGCSFYLDRHDRRYDQVIERLIRAGEEAAPFAQQIGLARDTRRAPGRAGLADQAWLATRPSRPPPGPGQTLAPEAARPGQ